MAGRKKLTDKCKPITVYVKESQIKKLGGIDTVRNMVLEHINSYEV